MDGWMDVLHPSLLQAILYIADLSGLITGGGGTPTTRVGHVADPLNTSWVNSPMIGDNIGLSLVLSQ